MTCRLLKTTFIRYSFLFALLSACTHSPSAQRSAESAGARSLTLKEEYQLGTKVGALILGNYRPLKSPFNGYASVMARYLAMYSPRPVVFKNYRASIIDCGDLAAISTPGGFIFLSKSIIEATRNEDELAGIVAHEVAHIALRHGEQSIRRKLAARKDQQETDALLDDLTELGDLFAEALGDERNEKAMEQVKRDRQLYGKLMTDLAEVMKIYRYNNNQEYAADKMALDLLLVGGYDPREYGKFLARNFSTIGRLKNSQKSPIRMFETHPLDEERVNRIRATVKDWAPGPKSMARDKRFEHFRSLAARAS